MNREIASYVDRLVALEKQKAEITADEADIKAEIKSAGYDAALVMKCVRLRLKDETKRRKELDQIELFDTYLAAAGLISDREPAQGDRAADHSANARKMVDAPTDGSTIRLADGALANVTIVPAGPRHVVAFVTEAPTIQTPAHEEGAEAERREDDGGPQPSSVASTEAATAGKVPPAPGANSGNDIDDGIPAWLDRKSPECTVGRRVGAA